MTEPAEKKTPERLTYVNATGRTLQDDQGRDWRPGADADIDPKHPAMIYLIKGGAAVKKKAAETASASAPAGAGAPDNKPATGGKGGTK